MSAIAHLLLVVWYDAPHKVGLGLPECVHQFGKLLLQRKMRRKAGEKEKGGKLHTIITLLVGKKLCRVM